MSLPDRILELVTKQPGVMDREIAELLLGKGAAPQPVNSACRRMAARGILDRRPRGDGNLGNYPGSAPQSTSPVQPHPGAQQDPLSEDAVKQALEAWLKADGWAVTVIWGRGTGIDIAATRNQERWIIEVKGRGSRPQMRVNYFLSILGELLQRMSDPKAKYSIAIPDLPQFRGLWSRLPALAKSRTTITALFVDEQGAVVEEC